MRFTSDTLEGFQRAGLSIAARVLVRDDLHLGPLLLTAAVAARLRSGLRALEAYVRRLLILLALKMEPDLKPDNRPCVIRMAQGKRATESKSFPLFSGENAFPDSLFSAPDPWAERPAKTAAPIYAAPLLERLKILKDLLEAPQARARRLAFYMARYRPGPMLAPSRTVSPRWGLEPSALYTAMGRAIPALSLKRPPPLGPAPRAPPQIRVL